ncbi:MAG: DUF3106 domain-containing protein [Verrucomicrobiales bacterium]|nr:DUF3106 domain-containing protein [Verrucomicrobiales bacterium]
MKTIFGVVLGLGLLLAMPVAGRAAAVPPPFPPLPASPVKIFRQLLAMTPEERDRALAPRAEAQREVLRSRLAEYSALPEAQREDRLRATDLYWHFQQLLRRSGAERDTLLASAPEILRPILAERLAIWDRMPTADREALLKQERVVRYFAHVRQTEPQPPPLPGTSVSAAPPVPLRVQSQLAKVQELSPETRRRVQSQWREFVEAPTPAAEQKLKAMSEADRRDMERVLDRFRQLSGPQRQACIDSFARFAEMKPAERADFLRRAERWEALNSEERAQWRALVTKLPPLPPARISITPPPYPQRDTAKPADHRTTE